MSDAINILSNDIAGLVDKVLDADTASKSNDKHNQQTSKRRPHFPVLIIPGFMSSGLEVKQSSIKPKWENERLWLNLKSLGLSKFISNNTKGKVVQQNYQKSLERRKSMLNVNDQDSDDDDDEENQQLQEGKEEVASTNIWIKHISLQSDLISDPTGIKVRPMSGLSGVDYLLPGALTNFMSYVFGPVINALRKVGYTDGKNLDAAPYDWRLPPSELERRDEYFTRTMEKVETLYNNNGGTKVVLLCHSLGCLCGEYLLRFANTRDESWTEKYIHTYMPIGAPHLGAPFSLRGLISGDCMGLETFLNDSEALAMSRSLGSIPWMIPSSIPSSTPAAAFVRREGAFEVTIHSTIDVSKLLDDRPEDSLPEKLELKLRYGKRKITSKLVPLDGDGKVTFEGVFVFATPEEGPSSKQCCFRCCQCCILKCARCACCSDNHLIVSINEPGVRAARATKRKEERKKKYCDCFKRPWCKFWLLPLFLLELCIKIAGFFLYLFAYKLWVVAVDCISRSSGGSSQLAVSAPIDLREFVDLPDSTDVEVILQNDMKKCRYCRNKAKTRQVNTTLGIRWISPNVPVNEESNKCQVAELCQKGHSQHITFQSGSKGKREWEYVTASGYGMLKKAGLGTTINCITGNYDTDKLTPRSSRSDHPPVKNIKAIYGINLPTEVGAIYKRKKIIAERKDKVKARFELDENAQLPDDSLWLNDDGILFETKQTPQTVVDGGIVTCSGDGTVPYWSLQHVNTWKDKCNIEVIELEGARHREILADERFHELLIDHVTMDNNTTSEDKV